MEIRNILINKQLLNIANELLMNVKEHINGLISGEIEYVTHDSRKDNKRLEELIQLKRTLINISPEEFLNFNPVDDSELDRIISLNLLKIKL